MTIKPLMMISLLFLVGCAEQNENTWTLQQYSEQGTYHAQLNCQTPPSVGPFQACHLQLSSKESLAEKLEIAVDGGMPAHGHGLPTDPIAVATTKAGQYRIEGLKYSMPGEWLLGFLVQTEDKQDKIIFKFTL